MNGKTDKFGFSQVYKNPEKRRIHVSHIHGQGKGSWSYTQATYICSLRDMKQFKDNDFTIICKGCNKEISLRDVQLHYVQAMANKIEL